jgi:hypothetical protein
MRQWDMFVRREQRETRKHIMSAFIVDAKTMHRVVGHILNNVHSFCGISTDAPDAGGRIGAALFTLNTESVNCRYREEEAAPSYKYRALPTTQIQAYKSMRCLLYQCSEGDQFENSRAYKELNAIYNGLAHWIIGHLDKFQQAEWG